jgi:predicted nicotinamide N-methyase
MSYNSLTEPPLIDIEPRNVGNREFTYVIDNARYSYQLENAEYAAGHGTIVWAASHAFAYHILSQMKEYLIEKRILDIGSGCGLTAMAAG